MKLHSIFVLVCVTFTFNLLKNEVFGLDLNSITCDHDKTLNLDVSGLDLYFYDFSINDVHIFPIQCAAEGILGIPHLDISRRFIVFLSGYTSNITSASDNQIRDAFKDLPDSYLIILDHSSYTNNKTNEFIKSYQRSVTYSYYIGKALAEVLVKLRRAGISSKKMHCIGYSLGGQVMGYTGQVFYEITGEKLWRITALDPAGPCYTNSSIEDQVRASAAEYVEIYHCHAGGYGTTRILGDINFFLNKKGRNQPDCEEPLLPDLTDSLEAANCHHFTCVNVWTATVKHGDWFLAQKCDPKNKFKTSANDVALAGFWNPGNATGVYCFSTEGHDLDF